jgi:hypothetical protein
MTGVQSIVLALFIIPTGGILFYLLLLRLVAKEANQNQKPDAEAAAVAAPV